MNGGAILSALSVNVVGGISGASAISTVNGTNTGVRPAKDPYTSASFDSYSGCTARNFSSKKTETLSPCIAEEFP